MRQICQASTEEAQRFKQQDKGEDNWDLFVTKWEGGGEMDQSKSSKVAEKDENAKKTCEQIISN